MEKVSKRDVELLKMERARLRDWNVEYGEDAPMAKAMNQARLRDINELLSKAL